MDRLRERAEALHRSNIQLRERLEQRVADLERAQSDRIRAEDENSRLVADNLRLLSDNRRLLNKYLDATIQFNLNVQMIQGMWRRRQSEREATSRLGDEIALLRQEVRRFGRAVIHHCCDVLDEMDGSVAALLEQAVHLVELAGGDEEDEESQVPDDQAYRSADEGVATAQEEPLLELNDATLSGTPSSNVASFGIVASTVPVGNGGRDRASNSDDELQFRMDDL